MPLSTIFSACNIGAVTLSNRIMRSATWEGQCTPEGEPTAKMAAFYDALAMGHPGLIVSGYTFVSPEGKQQVGMAGIHSDTFADAFRQVIHAVKQHEVPFFCQLVHAGGQAIPENSGLPSVAPSGIQTAQYTQMPGELTTDAIEQIINCFVLGATRAKHWGYDGVQLHGAHGYLINQFLSPYTNRRQDAFGGSLDNRMRFLLEILQRTRREVGANYPVIIKLSGADHIEGGLSEEDARTVCRTIAPLVDAIEISSGCAASPKTHAPSRTKIATDNDEGYNEPLALAVKKEIGVPVIAVGGYRSPRRIASSLKTGIDMVALSRPFIYEPQLTDRWKSGDTQKAKCVSCNRCFLTGVKGGISCMQKVKDERRASKAATH